MVAPVRTRSAASRPLAGCSVAMGGYGWLLYEEHIVGIDNGEYMSGTAIDDWRGAAWIALSRPALVECWWLWVARSVFLFLIRDVIFWRIC